MHQRRLSASPNLRPSTAEVFHWFQGTSLFNQQLSKPVQNSEKDALWATSAILGAISFSSIEASMPEEAWPLAPPSSHDLSWLRMSEGKKAIWEIANPLRADSAFHAFSLEDADDVLSIGMRITKLETLPSELIELCGLDRPSINGENPYRAVATSLAGVMDMECNQSTILYFLTFFDHISADYRRLLEQRDSRALLLLAYWYAKVCPYQQWWMQRRAVLEGQAICIYLERYHGSDPRLQNLLKFPKGICGGFTVWGF